MDGSIIKGQTKMRTLKTQAKVIHARLVAAEEAHPDCPHLFRLHKALNKARRMIGLSMDDLAYEPGTISTLDDGPTPPPPPPPSGGGGGKDDDNGDS